MSRRDFVVMLAYCLCCDAGPVLGQHWFNALYLRRRGYGHEKARHYRKHMLDQCWSGIEDVGPALNQYSTNFWDLPHGCLSGNCVMSGDTVDASG